MGDGCAGNDAGLGVLIIDAPQLGVLRDHTASPNCDLVDADCVLGEYMCGGE